MITKHCNTQIIKLYLSGPIEVAKQVLRQHCMAQGLCVTIEPTTYIFTGGEEYGYVVGLLNYPRFPMTPDELINRARQIMLALRAETHQTSALMVMDDISEWVSVRKEQS